MSNPYIDSVAQCFAKAAAHLEKKVLPNVEDPQTRSGIELLIEEAKKRVEEVRKMNESLENSGSEGITSLQAPPRE